MEGKANVEDVEILAVPRPFFARSPYLAIGGLGLMALFWGYNWVVMKVALRYAEPSAFVALRVFLGSVLLFFLIFVLRRPVRPRNLRLTLCIGLFQTTGSLGLMTWALAGGAAGQTAVLVFTMPLWLLPMSWVVLGERLRRLQWLSLGLAVAGLCLVVAPWTIHNSLFSNLLAVAAGILWAAGTVAAKMLSQRQRVDILSLNAWQMLMGSIPLVIVAFLVSDSPPVWSGSFVAALIFNVVPVTGLGLLLWFHALRTLSAGTAGFASLGTPVLGVVFSWIQLGERPSFLEAAGMVLIVSALCALALRQFATERKARSARFAVSSSSSAAE